MEHKESAIARSGDRRLIGETAVDAVRAVVGQWEGVITRAHRFGGIEFLVGRCELGHLHRSFADLPFTRSIRDELIAAGRARKHHVLPDSGWVTVPMRNASEVESVIDLFRLNYERATSRRPPDNIDEQE